VVTNTGWAQEDVRMRIQKATADFIKLYQVQKAKDVSITAKLKFFRSNTKFVFFMGPNRGGLER
jgi:hypothetical protein